MNFRGTFFVSIGLLALWLMLTGSLRADTLYTYKGNDYTNCVGSYCFGPEALSITFETTLTGSALDNLPIFTNITATVTAFSFTDGSGLDLNQGNTTNFAFSIETDSTGNIINTIFAGWEIEAGCYNYSMASVGAPPCPYASSISQLGSMDQSGAYTYYLDGLGLLQRKLVRGGEESLSPGTWTMEVVSTPEPSSDLLLGVGLLAVLTLAARRKCFTL
jgi:hypothetical protein